MKKLITLLGVAVFIVLINVQEVQAQRWNRYRKEVGVSIGTTALLGDLGGGPGVGSRYGDFQLQATRFAIGVTGKYRFHDRFAVKGSLIYAELYSDDALTENYGRKKRNLNVRTDLFELSGQLEFYIIRERIGSRYKLKGVKGYGSNHFSMYVFAGIGGIFYSPRGTTEAGDWVRLAPLNTEGQGLDGAPKDYNQLAVVFPFGVALKYNLTKSIGLQYELGMRMTSTDYLDDASTTYYDGNTLAAEFGDLSKEMADKRYNAPERHTEGGTRGDADKTDSYLFGMLTLTYRIRSRARSRVRL